MFNIKFQRSKANGKILEIENQLQSSGQQLRSKNEEIRRLNLVIRRTINELIRLRDRLTGDLILYGW